MFFATFLIGLREGLEASLIVGILAAFLKRNNASLRPLILATGAAVLASIGVGIVLEMFAQSLPQAQQEALETVIGIVAVVFVTTMILWTNANARSMKDSLESEAAVSLGKGGAGAMAAMAFLAVIKEGFETAVFLMAAFQVAQGDSAMLGLSGAAAGILLAIVIGYLIYYGGVRFNLGTFFRVTGPFLILLAAGFAANVFRTGHEAGWVNIGQMQVFDFSSFLSAGSVQGALITGMFSIQPDPRLVEVIAWLAYFIPVMIVYCWPRKWAFSIRTRRMVKHVAAGACALAAVLLFAIVPRGDVSAGDARAVADNASGVTAVRLVSTSADEAVFSLEGIDGARSLTLPHVSDGEADGMPLSQWEVTQKVGSDARLPQRVTLASLQQMNGNRLPSGLNAQRTPGPFEARWSESVTYSARTSGASLLRASCDGKLIAVLSGGGIEVPKTVSVSGAIDVDWSVSDEEAEMAESILQQARLQADEMQLWWLWCPVALLGGGIGLALSSLGDGRKIKRAYSL